MNAPTPMDRAFAEIDHLLDSRADLADRADRAIGNYILKADRNWRAASIWMRLLLPLLWWDRLIFNHLGRRFTVVEWRGKPFLIFLDQTEGIDP